jgi:hypothetical protein
MVKLLVDAARLPRLSQTRKGLFRVFQVSVKKCEADMADSRREPNANASSEEQLAEGVAARIMPHISAIRLDQLS